MNADGKRLPKLPELPKSPKLKSKTKTYRGSTRMNADQEGSENPGNRTVQDAECTNQSERVE